jgi:hypothetical protein
LNELLAVIDQHGAIMETKHTPGPWTAEEKNGRGMGWKAGPAWLGEKAWSEECAANARLIAAAPDLLEALQEIVSAADGEGWSQLDAAFSKARAAIAKATGQKGGKP